MTTAPFLAGLAEAEAPAGLRTIPFEYSFSYLLEGQADKTHSKTVTISIEGPFTAVAMGYGVVPTPMPLRFGPGKAEDYGLPIIASIEPRFATSGGSAFTLKVNGSNFETTSVVRWNGNDRPTSFVSPAQLKADIAAADIAAPGAAQITVFNPGPRGGTSNAISFTISAAPSAAVTGSPGAGPVASLLSPGAALVSRDVFAGPQIPFLRTSLGRLARVPFPGARLGGRPMTPGGAARPRLTPAPDRKFNDVPMAAILKSFRRAIVSSPRFLKGEAGLDAILRNGFRVRREILERVLLNGGEVDLDSSSMEELFEAVAAPPEQVLFLYSLHDEATGRAFQSEPVLSIAGLGISNGDRPFRQFATPIVFAPQTTIRLDVTEKSEFSGQLFISLQGYKVLGQPGTPTAARRR